MIIRSQTQRPAAPYHGQDGYVYFIQAVIGGPVKIGTALNPWVRMTELQSGNPEKLRLIAVMHGGSKLERACHTRLADDRLRGEWFRSSELLAALIDELAYAPPRKHRMRGNGLSPDERLTAQRKAVDAIFAPLSPPHAGDRL